MLYLNVTFFVLAASCNATNETSGNLIFQDVIMGFVGDDDVNCHIGNIMNVL